MNNNNLPANERVFVRNSIEASMRIGFVALLVFWSFDIVKPFIIPLVWGIIIAVAVYPHYLQLQTALGERKVLAASIHTLFIMILLIMPTILLAGTLVESVQLLAKGLDSGALAIPPPPESIGSLPFLGEPLMNFWHLAARNHEAAMQQIEPHFQMVSSWLLTTAEQTSLGILQFIVAIIISGYLLARAKNGQQFTLLILERFVGEQAQKVIDLVYAIVHSVALGIVGVAVIQAILAGLSFIVVGVPFAGLWAILCLLLSVVQIGIAPVVIPIIIYLFYSADTFTAVVFLIWSIPVTLMDNFLRAFFFSRGVKTPMVVVFMGSIGGFIASGIVGLFTGAVILSLSYGLFMNWVREGSR